MQSAIDGISRYCKANNILVSAQKCAVLQYGSVDASYCIDGTEISVEETVRDLGVLISANLNFAAHVMATSSSARNMINTLFRCFVIQNPDVYVKLYKAIIVPRLMYCVPVWRPNLIKYARLLEGVQKYFLRRLAFRCSSARILPVIPGLSTLFDNWDGNALLCILKGGSLSHRMSVEPRDLRFRLSIKPTFWARTDLLANIFFRPYVLVSYGMKESPKSYSTHHPL